VAAVHSRDELTTDGKREYNALIEQVNACETSATAAAASAAASPSATSAEAARMGDLQQLQAALRALSLCDDEGALHARVLMLARRLQMSTTPQS
jgi:hypothetical protein